jgi:hypothetical protein
VATRDDVGTICKQNISGSKFSGIEHIAFLQMKITRSNLKSGETGLIGARDIFQVRNYIHMQQLRRQSQLCQIHFMHSNSSHTFSPISSLQSPIGILAQQVAVLHQSIPIFTTFGIFLCGSQIYLFIAHLKLCKEKELKL